MKTPKLLLIVLAAMATATLTATINGAMAASSVEVVQSVPIETTLAVPGIRQTEEVWVDMINGAKSTIDLEQFYIYGQAGKSLDPVINALQAAAKRGVQIRFMIDSKFYATYPQIPNQLAATANFQVRTVDFSSYGGIQHAKYFVVDRAESFVGSANFDWLALTHIHEVGLHISDSGIATTIESIFSRDWSVATDISNKKSTTQPAIADAVTSLPDSLGEFQVNASPAVATPKGIADTLTSILALISSAKNTLQIQVYEYNTKGNSAVEKKWTTLDSAIRQAAARGVHVQLLVDQTALKAGKADLEALAKVSGVQVKVVTIPQWSGGPIAYARLVHSKYMIVDGTQGWVGSENWSEGYFTSTRNVGVVTQSAAVSAQLVQIFQNVWNSAYTSTP
jgi:phosphatidylserine/phosphatidylglycerophosphate/cardiolipin synthase-like enzyme